MRINIKIVSLGVISARINNKIVGLGVIEAQKSYDKIRWPQRYGSARIQQ